MPRITWDNTGEKKYEVGVDHVVHYLVDESSQYSNGTPWNGITGVSETPDGAEPNDQYADNIKYLSLRSAEELNGSITAYTYPDSWGVCDGSAEPIPGVTISQQTRKMFGLSYRTKIGNDVDGQDHGYKLHLLYGATVSPSERSYETMNDSPDPIEFSWDFTTVPVNVTGYNPTSLLTIDSTLCDRDKLAALENVLYGTESEDARMPLPDEVLQILGGSGSVETMSYRSLTD